MYFILNINIFYGVEYEIIMNFYHKVWNFQNIHSGFKAALAIKNHLDAIKNDCIKAFVPLDTGRQRVAGK